MSTVNKAVPELIAGDFLSRDEFLRRLHQKLEVYQEAGVQEYLAVLMWEREVRWHRLSDRRFQVVPAPADGIYRSTLFPGLWLDATAQLEGDLARVLAVLRQGLNSPEQEAFVKRLATNRPRKR